MRRAGVLREIDILHPHMICLKYIYFAFLLLFASCAAESPDKELRRWQEHARNTTIIRDDFGVPHIYGKTDADAVFGLLYAQCEDDFNRVERNYLWAIGRLAEVEGEEELYSDLRARMFMSREEAINQYEKSPEWLRHLCDAFADGINYYLYTHPDVRPRLLTRFESWMPMYFSEGSIGGDIERISTDRIRNFYEKGKGLSAREQFHLEKEVAKEEPKGSNGIAISGKLTTSGNAMLLINPHTSFYFRGEVHMVSEEGLNAYGAVTWGQFFIYQGFNERTGWMHTSTYTDVMDEFIETITEKEGKKYYTYGSEKRPLDSSEVTLQYRKGAEIKEKSFPLYRTHHGPITHKIGNSAVSTAMMWEPAKALEQSFVRTRQNDFKGFRKMMDYRTNSSNNTVYADADGTIAYFHGNFIPIRDTVFDYSQPVDGSNPKTDWQGLHEVGDEIMLVNPENGWLQNCNSTPFTAAMGFSPKRADYPEYMSIDQENYRGIHAIQLLSGKSGYTLDSLLNLAYDPYLPAFAELLPGLVKAYDKATFQDPELKAPIEILRKWDYRTSAESVAMTLAHYYGTLYGNEGKPPAGLSDMELFRYFGHSSPESERLEIFKRSISVLKKDFGTWELPWGEINRYQRINGEIRQPFNDSLPSIPVGFASGRWGALAAFGASYENNTKKIYGTRGNSFVAVVEFGDRIKAKSILAGGQSGDPASPHFDDQSLRYSQMQFKEVAFYREDVLKRARKTYHPGN